MSKPRPISVSVTRLIAARPETVYDLISDIPRMSQFSPETTSARWLLGADHAGVGVRFKGTNAIGRTRWSTRPTITAAIRGNLFAFKVPGRSGPDWTYAFVAVDGGTEVTERMSQAAASPVLIRPTAGRRCHRPGRAPASGHDHHTGPSCGRSSRP